MADINLPREGQGFRADVKFGDTAHLILLAVNTALGPAAAVYNAKTGKWWSNREWAADIEEAKKKAEGLARAWYEFSGYKLMHPFPVLKWTETG